MWDYVILEIYGQICVIWIVYESLSVFKWLQAITGEFVKFRPFGSLCVIVRKMTFLCNFDRLCRIIR